MPSHNLGKLSAEEGKPVLVQWRWVYSQPTLPVWGAVWLLAPSLNTGNRFRTFVSSLAVMFAVGFVGYLAYFGFSCSMETLASVICFWTVGCVSLPLALTLSGVCCRKTFHSGLIALWLILWLPLSTTIGMVVGVFSMFLISGGPVDLVSLVSIGLMVLFGSLFVSGFLYAVNLPVLLLAGLTDCYRERLRALVFRKLSGDTPFVPTPVLDDRPIDV